MEDLNNNATGRSSAATSYRKGKFTASSAEKALLAAPPPDVLIDILSCPHHVACTSQPSIIASLEATSHAGS